MNKIEELYGAPIHVYTRAQALEDGVLVDVSETAREAGFTVPVAVTAGVFERCIAWDESDGGWQNQSGRLWDVCWMARCAGQQAKSKTRVMVQLRALPRASARPARVRTGGERLESQLVTLYMHIRPGDDGAPVITIMLPGED